MIKFEMGQDVFRERWFEQQSIIFRKAIALKDRGWRLIDQALDLHDPTRELFKVLLKGRVDPATYVEEFIDVGIRRRRIRKERLYALLGQGATIVLNRIELVSLPVREICNEIGRFVGAQTTSNAYASFGKEPATNVHWDTHDVFVVQVSGRKRWQIYEPTHPLPLSSQISNERKDEVPQTPAIDEVIEAGDVLYVPRGWWHRVEPVAGHETVHLTVAVHTPLILDYLVWACASVLPDLIETRYSLLGEQHDAERVAAALDAASQALRNPQALTAFYTRSHQRERVVSPFNIEGLLREPDGELDDEMEVVLNSRVARPADIRINGDIAPLTGVYDHVARALADTMSMKVAQVRAQLPGVNPTNVDGIIRDLARADLVRLIPAASDVSATEGRANRS